MDAPNRYLHRTLIAIQRQAPRAYSYADPYGNKSLGALYSLDRRDFGMQEITQALR